VRPFFSWCNYRGVKKSGVLMLVEIFPGDALPGDLVAEWRKLRDGQPELATPFLAPEFIQCVAAARPGVQVMVVSDCQGLALVAPFYRQSRTTAGPVADTFSDIEGAIIRPGFRPNVTQLMRAARLTRWQFRRWLAHQTMFTQYAACQYGNPLIDLSNGWDAYYRERRAAGSELWKKTAQKKRRIERSIGEIRFDFHQKDFQQLELVLQWKRHWTDAKGIYNPIGEPWHRELLRNLLHCHTDRFGSGIASLFVNDQFIAGIFYVRDGARASLWISGFDPEFGAYTPGMVCYYELLRAAPEHGLFLFEEGCGDEFFKTRLSSKYELLAEGEISRWPGVSSVRRAWMRSKRWLRESPLMRPVYSLVQKARMARARASAAQLTAKHTCATESSDRLDESLAAERVDSEASVPAASTRR